MTATGLSVNPQQYRDRLEEQPDDRADSWAGELMRDTSIRVGVRQVVAELKHAFGTDDAGLRRIYAAGGGPASAIGTTEQGELMVPAISLYYFVSGAHVVFGDARSRLINYLVANFEEIVYI